jgi:hypothetical protein
MSEVAPPAVLDRYTTMGEMSLNVRRILRRMMPHAAVVLAGAVVYLAVTHSPGTIAFALMAAGALIALQVWSHGGLGVPLMPMMIVQQLVISGLPIVTGHPVVTTYRESLVTAAGVEVFAFCVAAAVAWRVAMNLFRPAPPVAYALIGLDRHGPAGLGRIGFWLVGAATGYLLLESLNLLDTVLSMLPNGSYPIVGAAVSAASACGFFLLSMIVGARHVSGFARTAFWVLVVVNCLISASSLLLSTVAIVLSSVVIGLFWSTGRIPWRLMLGAAVILSLLNTGKYGMRAHYWHSEDAEETSRSVNLTDLPGFYTEWVGYTVEAMSGTPPETSSWTTVRKTRDDQGLLERLNNLQNLLFVIDAVEDQHISTLGGKTYAVIPPLLIPRIFWPDKPRSHEGQVLLNVHFGRQLLESTFTTYVAWGLLAEAYGNFGPIQGAVFIGIALGLFFAWAENYTSRKPLLSIEGFVAFAVFLGLANSFEMVASVMVTSIFQSLVPIIAACAPFVQHKVVVRPES